MSERHIFNIKAIQSKDPNHYKSSFKENDRDKEKTWGIVNELTKKTSYQGNRGKWYEFFNGHFATIGPKLHVSWLSKFQALLARICIISRLY